MKVLATYNPPKKVRCIDDDMVSLKKGDVYEATEMIEFPDPSIRYFIPAMAGHYFSYRFEDVDSSDETSKKASVNVPIPYPTINPIVEEFDFEAYNALQSLPGKRGAR